MSNLQQYPQNPCLFKDEQDILTCPGKHWSFSIRVSLQCKRDLCIQASETWRNLTEYKIYKYKIQQYLGLMVEEEI